MIGQRRRALLGAVLAGSAILPAAWPGAQAALDPGPWPMAQHDVRHTGQASIAGPRGAAVAPRCTYGVGHALMGSPVVGADATIYVPAGARPTDPEPRDGFLVALAPDCTQRWAAPLPGPPAATAPAIAADGTIYVHSNGKEGNIAAPERLTAVNPDGTVKWVFTTNLGSASFVSSEQSSPAVAPDGTIWFGSMDTRLYALNPDGTEKCVDTRPFSNSRSRSPAIGPDGTVYIDSLVAYNPDCSTKWEVSACGIGGSTGDSSPAVGADGAVYLFASDDLCAVNPDGSTRWTLDLGTGAHPRAPPAIAADGTIYANADGLYAVTPAGQLRWKRYCRGSASFSVRTASAPIIGSDGTVYTRINGVDFGDVDEVCAFAPDGTLLWSYRVEPGYAGILDPGLAIGANGDLLVGEGGLSNFDNPVPVRLRSLTPPGYLRVVTSPPVPSQILIDGKPSDSWGVWLPLGPGPHTVGFTRVEGYTTPPGVLVNVIAGSTATVTGTFVRNGTLRVQTEPALPATILVDGVARNDWGMWTDLPAGPYQVCFGPVSGYTPPPCQNVTLTGGNVTNVTGAYAAHAPAPGASGFGYLRVTTSPAVPSQITVNGIPRDSWGLWLKLPPGEHLVAFGSVEGYQTPDPQLVTIAGGATTEVTGAFARLGTLRVVTSPAVAATITVDGVARNEWGLWTHFPAGYHRVCFQTVPGRKAPPCRDVTLAPGAVTNVTASYPAM